MTDAELLLRAYWELLYERLDANRVLLSEKIDSLLRAIASGSQFPQLNVEEKRQAYRQACVAFIEERIESYNPLGIQYTFDRSHRIEAAKLGFELDWYNGKAEFEQLVAAARNMAEPGMSDHRLARLAEQLIRRHGAYPDRSIIAGYESSPALQKLPDYIAARAIEEIIAPTH